MNPYLAELVGTAIMILFGGGVVANVALKQSKAEGGGWLVICIAWGFAVMLGVYAVGEYSGGHFNPAVSLGLAISGQFPWSMFIGYFICQLLGAIIGATLVWLHFLPHFKATDNPIAKRDVFCTTPALDNYVTNLLSEMIATMILVLAILFIGINEITGGLKPVVVGFLIMALGLSLGGTTGYAINPVRDLGPRIAHYFLPIAGKTDSNWKYAFVPVLAPLVGGMLGASLYGVLFRVVNVTTKKANPMSLGASWAWLFISLFLVIVTLLYGNYKNKTVLKGNEAKVF